MKKLLILSLLISIGIVVSCKSSGQKNTKTEKPEIPNDFRVVFYNCENLFDTINNLNVNDDEWVPTSKLKWNTKKYTKKVRNISRVISIVNSEELPALVGLGEIENRNVLNDLVNSPYLKDANYQIVYHENNGRRNVDEALLIKPDRIKLLISFNIPVVDSDNYEREILYAKVLVMEKDTLNIFVNHWRSRNGDMDKTESKRLPFASKLREKVDSLFSKNANANILIMGDFNDEPDNTSISLILSAWPLTDKIYPESLYNLFYLPFKSGAGTVFHKRWLLFDQMIVSSNLLVPKEKGLHYKTGSAMVIEKKWMLYPTSAGSIPFGSFDDKTYLGGYSDHLPVIIMLKTKKEKTE